MPKVENCNRSFNRHNCFYGTFLSFRSRKANLSQGQFSSLSIRACHSTASYQSDSFSFAIASLPVAFRQQNSQEKFRKKLDCPRQKLCTYGQDSLVNFFKEGLIPCLIILTPSPSMFCEPSLCK